MSTDLAPARSVDEVIVSLHDGVPPRSASEEREAFLSLSDALARSPETAVKRLVEVAMRLTGADGAGVSLEEVHQGEEIFRWVAVAGAFERYLNGTMPRRFSPCGTTVDRGRTLLMRDPVRFFPYVSKLHVHIKTVLLVPFHSRGRLAGTLWVMTTREDKTFSVEDARLVESLTTFSSSLLDALSTRREKKGGAS